MVPRIRANTTKCVGVSYDRTKLAENDIATATATISSHFDGTAKMVMVDLGIPPGFELLSDDLDTYLQKSAGGKGGYLEKYSMTAIQASSPSIPSLLIR
jgi:hypothetical protein